MTGDGERRGPPLPADRSRAAWWAVGAACLAVVALFLHAFVGTFVLGLFVYYAARPLQRRVNRWLSDDTAAVVTMALIVLPALAILAYVSVVAVRELAAVLGSEAAEAVIARIAPGSDPFAELLRDPVGFLSQFENLGAISEQATALLGQFGVLVTGVVHLTLALALAFFLYRDDERLAGWFRQEVAGEGSAADAYLTAIDHDLETVYFGNLLTVILVTGMAVVLYNGFNLLAPPPVALPFPTLLALLTGLATFVPLVVGKIVYLPAAGLLVLQTVGESGVSLAAPGAFLLASFVLLDLLPQSVIRPYVSGRTLHTGMVLFSYVLGTALFGWYGLFYGPFLVVVVVQFANVVLPELVGGGEVTAATSSVLGIGSDPPDVAGGAPDPAVEPADADHADHADHVEPAEAEQSDGGDPADAG